MRRVVISGIGLIGPTGIGLDPFWSALVEGRCGIERITRFDPSTYPCQVGGEVRDRAYEAVLTAAEGDRRFPLVVFGVERLAKLLFSFVEFVRRGVDSGELIIRGQPVTIEYYQGGAKGQGRIRIAAAEVERLTELMRVRTQPVAPRRPYVQPRQFPGITVPLGRPGV